MTRASTVCSTPVMIYDWYPTLLKAAGDSAPRPDIDGLDLFPLLKDPEDPTARQGHDRSLVWHFPNLWGPLSQPTRVEGPGMGPSSTIRLGDWKLIYYHSDRRFELFDLAHDLGEEHDLAADQPRRVRDLAAELTRLMRTHRAPMPIVKSTGQPVPLPAEALATSPSGSGG